MADRRMRVGASHALPGRGRSGSRECSASLQWRQRPFLSPAFYHILIGLPTRGESIWFFCVTIRDNLRVRFARSSVELAPVLVAAVQPVQSTGSSQRHTCWQTPCASHPAISDFPICRHAVILARPVYLPFLTGQLVSSLQPARAHARRTRPTKLPASGLPSQARIVSRRTEARTLCFTMGACGGGRDQIGRWF